MTAREAIAFLVGSEHRVALLDALTDPRRPCELDETLAASRATIQRTLSGFEDRGWAVKQNGCYRLTTAGELIRESYTEFERVVGRVGDSTGTLACLDDVDLPAAALVGTTTTTASPTAPHAPLERYTSAVREASPQQFVGICPVVSSVFNEAHRPLVEDGVPSELVIDQATFEAAREVAPDSIEVGHEAPAFTLYVSPEPVSFGLAVVDDHVFVKGYDDQGRLQGCLDGHNDVLYEWATETFQQIRGRADRVEPAQTVGD